MLVKGASGQEQVVRNHWFEKTFRRKYVQIVAITVPAEGLAQLDAKASAVTVMAKIGTITGRHKRAIDTFLLILMR